MNLCATVILAHFDDDGDVDGDDDDVYRPNKETLLANFVSPKINCLSLCGEPLSFTLNSFAIAYLRRKLINIRHTLLIIRSVFRVHA